jgi:hypothetical protein
MISIGELKVSEYNFKKPESREEFIRVLTDAAKREMQERIRIKEKPTKPTVSGTAKILNIHRDTLYTWLKQFNVDFGDICKQVSAKVLSETVEVPGKYTYLIGEALVGEGNEVAHIDLLIGDKDGPVGEAFAQGLSNLSMGHTPLLAVISLIFRLNLIRCLCPRLL